MILLLYQLSYAAEGERHRDDDGPKKLGIREGQVNRPAVALGMARAR
jgi:hypothetical protein